MKICKVHQFLVHFEGSYGGEIQTGKLRVTVKNNPLLAWEFYLKGVSERH